MRVWLHELKWKEVREYLSRNDVILLPIGSTEQHGGHLPLGTDSLAAIHLCEDAARKAGVLVAPPVWYGWSPHHMAYPGTVTVKPETLAELLVEICQCLISHGFLRIVIVNGHRGANIPPAQIAATRVRNLTGAYVAILDPYYAGELLARKIRESGPGGVGHADELETSHMLYLRPELVDMTLAVRNVPEVRRFHIADPYVEGDRATVPPTVEEYRDRTAPSGTSGDPAPSTVEKGRIYHEYLVEAIVQFIQEAKRIPVSLKPFTIPF